MQRQNYDWLFIFAIVIVLSAFVSTEFEALGGENTSILAVITAVGGLLSNVSAARFEQKNQNIERGKLNAWVVGVVTAAALYVMLNAIIFVVGLVLLGEEQQFVQRNALFVSNRGYFGEYVALSASAVAALLMSVISVFFGATIVSRSQKHLTSTIIATFGYVGIAIVIRLASYVHGDIAQFAMFEQIGWKNVLIGLILNLSIVSSMIWLGVVLVRGRQS